MKKSKIMGIINVTSDSFYAPSRTPDPDLAIKKAHEFVKCGADFIDIGGESSRPQDIYGRLADVSVEVELERILPVIKSLAHELKVPLSIDTTKPEVAKAAVDGGARMINDISGFRNPKMRQVAVAGGVDICVVHMQGEPKTMQKNPVYEKGVVAEVYDFLDKQTQLLISEGVDPEHIIIDPGIGFGKSMQDNFELVKNAATFKKLGFRLLYGISRKAFICHFLNKERNDILSAVIALNTYLMRAQVDILRVHDVEEHCNARDVLAMI